MELQYFIGAVMGIITFFVGWMLKRLYHQIDALWAKLDEMTINLTKLAIELPQQYVTKNDLTHAIDIIHERFDKLDTKLDKIYEKQI